MATKIIYQSENPDRFWALWQIYLDKHKVGPVYLKVNLDFHLALSAERGYLKENRSFVYEVDNEPVACVVLPVEVVDSGVQISMEGGYAYAPLSATPAIEKEVFRLIDTVAVETGTSRILFVVDPLEAAPYNYLQKYQYLDTSILSYVIDLSPENLLKSCRKGHISDIKRVLNDARFKTRIITVADHVEHKAFQTLHHRCAGKITRSDESFELQFQKLIQGTAFLVGLDFDSRTVAYSYFELCNGKAAYASGVDDPDYADWPLYHSVVYTAMKYLKSLGVTKMDTLQPSAPSAQLDYYPDDKQLNIARFKRGFGGSFVPHYRGVKYFNHSVLATDLTKANKLLTAFPTSHDC